MRVVARTASDADRKVGVRRQGMAAKQRTAGEICHADVSVRGGRARSCRSWARRSPACRARAVAQVTSAPWVLTQFPKIAPSVKSRGGRNNARVAEWGLCRRGGNQNVLAEGQGLLALRATGRSVRDFADRAQVQMVCQTWQRRVWWHRFLRPSRRCRELRPVTARGLRRSHVLLAQRLPPRLGP